MLPCSAKKKFNQKLNMEQLQGVKYGSYDVAAYFYLLFSILLLNLFDLSVSFCTGYKSTISCNPQDRSKVKISRRPGVCQGLLLHFCKSGQCTVLYIRCSLVCEEFLEGPGSAVTTFRQCLILSWSLNLSFVVFSQEKNSYLKYLSCCSFQENRK